jgi:fibronectin type 3 domain-containing protein
MRYFMPHLAGVVGAASVFGMACGDSPGPTNPSGSDVVVSWDQSPAPDVAVYRIYIGENSGVYTRSEIVSAPADSLLLSDLGDGKTYYFAVTAIDAAGNESALSDEVSVDLSTG